jgi:hypothetical protein
MSIDVAIHRLALPMVVGIYSWLPRPSLHRPKSCHEENTSPGPWHGLFLVDLP